MIAHQKHSIKLRWHRAARELIGLPSMFKCFVEALEHSASGQVAAGNRRPCPVTARLLKKKTQLTKYQTVALTRPSIERYVDSHLLIKK